MISMVFSEFLDIFQASDCALSNIEHYSIEALDTTGDSKSKKLWQCNPKPNNGDHSSFGNRLCVIFKQKHYELNIT